MVAFGANRIGISATYERSNFESLLPSTLPTPEPPAFRKLGLRVPRGS